MFTLTAGFEDTGNATPTSVEDAVRGLNGDDRNDAYLRHDSGCWMGFGVGPARVFVSYSDSPEGPHYQAVSNEEPSNTVSVMLGGQRVELPDKYLLPVDSAVEAAQEFLATAARPLSLVWEPQ